MNTKKISLIIAACLLMDNSAFAASFEMPVDTTAPVIQTAVFQLASLVRLPFTITANLIQQEAPLAPVFSNPSNGRPDKATKNGKDKNAKKDSNFFFSSQLNELKPSLKTNGAGGAAISISLDRVRGSGVLWFSLIFYWLGFKYIFLLACLMSLSKSNLPWEIRDISV
jgi:hypothetical protein